MRISDWSSDVCSSDLLRQAREKLEARDLENIELRKRLAAEENDLAAARDDAKAVRLKLKQVHKELLNLAQAQPDFPSGASTVGGRLGLLPSRIRAKRVRKKAETGRES